MTRFFSAAALLLAAAGAAAGPLEYIEAALANSLDLRQAEAQVEAAAEAIEVARAGRRPQLRAGGGWRLDDKGPPDADRLTARVTGTQELLNLARPLEIDLAERRRARAELNLARLEQGILSSTYQAYLRASLAQGSLGVLERREASLQEQKQAAESLFSVGKVNVLQVLNVEAQLAALGAERVAAANALENAVAELEHLAYRDADAIDALGGGPLDLDPLDFDSWLAAAYGAPDVQLAELDVAIARADMERQEKSLLPSLEFEANLDQEGEATYGINFSSPL
ncbi:MAG: TolC family protein, partial [Betaproteobacteria bacterium AqS2]|nr:TolC family protein [Betaproteobacteria bacterium AqS2]